MNAKRLCPICETKEVKFLHSQSFELQEGHPLLSGYDIVSCSLCGFVYADTSVTQSEYDRFYSEYSKYEDAKTGTGGIENPFDWKRQKETAIQIASVLNNTNAKILDVGCANGGLLLALKELGYLSLCGIDPSPVCVENTKRLGVEAYQGSLFLPFSGDEYDCVILSHTLEHVHDIRGALDWIRKRLRPNGIVYIETPDAMRYIDYVYAPFQDFNTEHINHFSLLCLKNLFQLQGFGYLSGGEKSLVVGENMFYPAVFGFWKKLDVFTTTLLQTDKNLYFKIQKYISLSTQIMSEIDSRISDLIGRSPSIIVWGTGQLLMKLLVETSLSHADIVAFVDNNPINQGKILHGKKIVTPLSIQSINEPILITTLLHHRSVAKQIRDLGLDNEIVFLEGE